MMTSFLSLSPSMLTQIRAATSQHVRWKPHQPSPHTWHSDISTLCQTLPGSWREVTMTNNNIVNFIRSLMLQLQINLHLSVKVLSHCSLYCKKKHFYRIDFLNFTEITEAGKPWLDCLNVLQTILKQIRELRRTLAYLAYLPLYLNSKNARGNSWRKEVVVNS